MELLILGASHGVPTIDRHCSCTLIKYNNTCYLVDAGAPIADLLIRHGIPYEDIRAIFLSHRHADHVIGMADFCNLSSWYFTKASFDAYYPEQDCIDRLKQFIFSGDYAHDPTRLRFHTYEAGVIYRDENITVTALPTNHLEGIHPTYGFMVEGDGQRVLFTGDLHNDDPQDFPSVAFEQPSDLVICELAHFHVPAVLPYMKKCRTKKFLFHHYNEKWTQEIVDLKNSSVLPFPVDMLHDGDHIVL